MQMKMSLIQLTLAASTLLAVNGYTKATTKGTAYVSETAELMCEIPNPESLEKTSKLAVYWQTVAEEVLVLYEFENGELKTGNIDKKYKNRTGIRPSNWNLLLHDVTLQDEGTYRCIVFNTTGWRKRIHECEHKLDVIVNNTSPEISSITSNGSEKFGRTVKLVCSSRQYYPDPEGIIWIIQNSSGTFNVEEDSIILNDNQTQIFNISSVLTIYVDVNTSVSCMIKANQSLKSKPQDIVIKPEPLQDDDGYAHYIWIAFGVVGLFAISAAVILVVWKFRPAQGSPEGSSQQNGNANQTPLVEIPPTNADTPAEQNTLLNGVEPHP